MFSLRALPPPARSGHPPGSSAGLLLDALHLPLLWIAWISLVSGSAAAADFESFANEQPMVHSSSGYQHATARSSWQPAGTYRPPAGGKTLLGKFSSGESATLHLDKLPEHQYLLVRLDLVILCHWDGIWESYGPDQWFAAVDDGPRLLSTTFSNFERAAQNFPDERSGAVHEARSGASSDGDFHFVKEMGEQGVGWLSLDTTYTIWLAIEHDDRDARICFSGVFHDGPDGPDVIKEAWAIAACEVRAIPPGVHPDPATTAAAISSFMDTTRPPGNDMIASLVVAGDQALVSLHETLTRAGRNELCPLAEDFPDLQSQPLPIIIERLHDENFPIRERATRELDRFLPEHRPTLIETARSHPEPEVRIRIHEAIQRRDEPEVQADPEQISDLQILSSRLQHLLRLRNSDQAKSWRRNFP